MSLRGWWLRRSVRYRITMVATTVTVLCLVILAQFTSSLQGSLLLDAADSDLQSHLSAASSDVSDGRLPTFTPGDIVVRVLDRAGDPVDGGPPAPLSEHQVTALNGGEGVLDTSASPPRRWLGTVVTAPDGGQRLVVAGAVLVGFEQAQGLALQWSLVAAL
ncbi:MAG TPA: two-component sensor histidine kinase, partial [Pseudonocardiaceae bacterium]|nr:two-component sensor histidine kinase [Pseudonocardiaceae bacterium]